MLFQERMNNNVEPDAHVVQLNYKMALININSQLGKRDIEPLKFLCSDFIPVCKIEQMKTGLDIMQALQQMCYISQQPENIHFLAELLYLIGRVDLLRKLNTSQEIVQSTLSDVQYKHVSPYRYGISHLKLGMLNYVFFSKFELHL